ncbi:AAA family ATPase [Yoonia sp.]|uniref:AAA family ATPase n=1 Tax=Yoonia sp. TaxID=2212373 RepID=UPI0035C86DB3
MPTIISVASGKGGVGKSSLAVNMSTRLQDGYGPTLLVDSDLLMANSHVLLNTRPTVDLIDVLEGRCDWREAVQKLPNGLSLLPGRTAANVLVESDAERLKDLLHGLKTTAHDFAYIIVDVPAGSGTGVMNTVSVADHTMVVLLGQATSFVDAYALIKNAYFEKNVTSFSAVVNMAKSAEQAKMIFDNFERTVLSFLPVKLVYAGYMPKMSEINASSVHGRSIDRDVMKARIYPKIDSILAALFAEDAGYTGPDAVTFHSPAP